MIVPISRVDTARLILKALAQAFPDVSFSVGMLEASKGLSVGWTDGPTQSDVEKVTWKFCGMIYEPRYGSQAMRIMTLEGVRVWFAVDVLEMRRTYTAGYLANVAGYLERGAGPRRGLLEAAGGMGAGAWPGRSELADGIEVAEVL